MEPEEHAAAVLVPDPESDSLVRQKRSKFRAVRTRTAQNSGPRTLNEWVGKLACTQEYNAYSEPPAMCLFGASATGFDRYRKPDSVDKTDSAIRSADFASFVKLPRHTL
jgi:hypothetical protein